MCYLMFMNNAPPADLITRLKTSTGFKVATAGDGERCLRFDDELLHEAADKIASLYAEIERLRNG